jgi:transposase
LEWKNQAERLFFIYRKTIKEISKEINVSEKTISNYLKTFDSYIEEKQNRKLVNKTKRKEYKKVWEKENRMMTNESDKIMLKNQHYTDVGILTFEKF